MVQAEARHQDAAALAHCAGATQELERKIDKVAIRKLAAEIDWR